MVDAAASFDGNRIAANEAPARAPTSRQARLTAAASDGAGLVAQFRLDLRAVQQVQHLGDARLVAAIRVHGVNQLLTFNVGDFRRYIGIAVLSPDDVLALMDTTADGVIACVADAGATFLAPIFDELAAVVCLSGTPLSHIGIVSREYQVPCVMAATLAQEPTDGDIVEVDCSTTDGVVRA